MIEKILKWRIFSNVKKYQRFKASLKCLFLLLTVTIGCRLVALRTLRKVSHCLTKKVAFEQYNCCNSVLETGSNRSTIKKTEVPIPPLLFVNKIAVGLFV